MGSFPETYNDSKRQLCEDFTLKIGNKAGQKLKKAWKCQFCKQQKLGHTLNLFKLFQLKFSGKLKFVIYQMLL